MVKEIIIDGIDVRRCNLQGETIEGITCGDGERIWLATQIITKHRMCKDNPNCHFKQRKRAELKLEKVKNYCLKNKASGWVDVEGIIEIIEGKENE